MRSQLAAVLIGTMGITSPALAAETEAFVLAPSVAMTPLVAPRLGGEPLPGRNTSTGVLYLASFGGMVATGGVFFLVDAALQSTGGLFSISLAPAGAGVVASLLSDGRVGWTVLGAYTGALVGGIGLGIAGIPVFAGWGEFGALLGFAIGAAVGGPLGGAGGAVLAARLDEKGQSKNSLSVAPLLPIGPATASGMQLVGCW